MILPLYGFVEGDTVGVLILADKEESVESMARKLREAVTLRVDASDDMEVVYQGVVLDPLITLGQAHIAPLQRLDLRRKNGVQKDSKGG
jgi:Toluene-4-monooxygenase system protein B (TmoB)